MAKPTHERHRVDPFAGLKLDASSLGPLAVRVPLDRAVKRYGRAARNVLAMKARAVLLRPDQLQAKTKAADDLDVAREHDS